MTRYGTYFVATFLAALAWTAYQDVQTIKPVKITSKNYGQGLLLFGDKQPAKTKFLKVGHTTRWVGEDGRSYSLRPTAVRMAEHAPNWIEPTPEQFDEWLATGGEVELQEWLKQ